MSFLPVRAREQRLSELMIASREFQRKQNEVAKVKFFCNHRPLVISHVHHSEAQNRDNIAQRGTMIQTCFRVSTLCLNRSTLLSIILLPVGVLQEVEIAVALFSTAESYSHRRGLNAWPLNHVITRCHFIPRDCEGKQSQAI